MSLSVAIVGLPNVGKSTLFNALLGRQIADVADYPFTTIEPNIGVVAVPDQRLEKLAATVTAEQKRPVKVVPAAIKFVDIAGLVKGAYKGEGLGNQFLAHIREVDVILHLLRLFKNPNAPHPRGKIAPAEDREIVEMELILKDLETVEKGLAAKVDTKSENALLRVKAGLEKGKKACDLDLSEDEVRRITSFQLLTLKPTLYVLNINEAEMSALKDETHPYGGLGEPLVVICAKLEAELSEIPAAERRLYLAELELSSSTLDKVIEKSYKLLGLITFYTQKGGRQVQAWPLKKGSTAYEAAGKVHTDFAKGFVKAEVVESSEVLKAGSWVKARKEGKIRIEGRDYIMKDREVVEFRHQ